MHKDVEAKGQQGQKQGCSERESEREIEREKENIMLNERGSTHYARLRAHARR
jgi:hypothetical protein